MSGKCVNGRLGELANTSVIDKLVHPIGFSMGFHGFYAFLWIIQCASNFRP